jgi:hypothetical protein
MPWQSLSRLESVKIAEGVQGKAHANSAQLLGEERYEVCVGKAVGLSKKHGLG